MTTGTASLSQRAQWAADGIRRLFSGTGWRREVVLYLSCYLTAETVAWLVTGTYPLALANAHSILAAEATLGLNMELGLQHTAEHLHLIVAFDYIYLAAQFVVLPVALVWLYRRKLQVYLLLRNAIIGSWLVAVPIYGLVPTAPPRLAHVGLQDVLASKSGLPINSGLSQLLYNPFAAFPSLHVGFAFAIAVAVIFAFRSWYMRVAAVIWGPLVTLTVVATGNHFVLDGVAGICVTLLGFGLGLVPLSWSSARPGVEPAGALGTDGGYEIESRLA